MKLLIKGDGLAGFAMHLADAAGRALCGRRLNQNAWHVYDLQAPVGHLCVPCRRKQVAASIIRVYERNAPNIDIIPGDVVVWLSRLLGSSGPDIVEGRNVTIVEVQVVQIGRKRVQVCVPLGGRNRLIWVDPGQLRRTDDVAVLKAQEIGKHIEI